MRSLIIDCRNVHDCGKRAAEISNLILVNQDPVTVVFVDTDFADTQKMRSVCVSLEIETARWGWCALAYV